MFEGTNLSEGRGTTRPFELIGAPFVEPYSLVRRLAEQELPGVILQPYYFKPTVNKFAGQVCGGVKLNITDRRAFRPLLTALVLLRQIISDSPSSFAWRPPPYEYEFEKPPFDIIAGCDTLRQQLEGGCGRAEIAAYCADGLAPFARRRQEFLLY